MERKNLFGPGSRFQQFWSGLRALKPRWAAFRHQAALHKCMLQLIARGSDPRAAGIALKLFKLWGDPLDQPRESYLRSCLREFHEVDGPVLVSGASLMVLILGAISAGDKNRTIWCLEQNPHWANVLRSWIDRYGIKGTYIINAPATVKSGIVRFRVDVNDLPNNIGLVLCDGPRASAGSAFSTLLTVGTSLSPAFTIFARKIKIDSEGPLIKRWALKHGATFVLLNKGDGFAKISRRELQQSLRPETAAFALDG